MGQTPPPWHGQAVATKILFDHVWPGFEVHRLRMEFSEEMVEVGRFQWKKIAHMLHLIREAGRILQEHPGCVLFYPPASAKWIPFIRDIVFLTSVRRLAGSTVFIYHASGLPVFCQKGILRRMLSRMAYHGADVALEVSQEKVPPHEVFAAKSWQWCPCAIEVPDRERPVRVAGSPVTVLFVGSLQEGKGILEILKTASILRKRGLEKDFRFRVIGKWFSNDFEEATRHLRSEFDLDDMVELTGQMTGDDKWEAYFGADVFFFPTHYESEATPIVLMEALGAGLPLITTEWAGIPAMLEGCPTARLLPVKSPEAYATALIEFHQDPGNAAATSRASREFYEEKFLPARFIERVEKAFRHAAEAGSAPSMRAHANEIAQDQPAPMAEEPVLQSPTARGLRISIYLADQNPGYDRSFGISRMSQVVISALARTGFVEMRTVVSKTSQQPPSEAGFVRQLPWGTRGKMARLLTDHLHPLVQFSGTEPDLYYFPKGYLPLTHWFCQPSVVTIHDTIIQHYADIYPKWRKRWEYAYWSTLLRHTLRHADSILTVSESSKRQIVDFMNRHDLPSKKITVTYEPCQYESIPQPDGNGKGSHFIHLASREPHKRTAHLLRWWHDAEQEGRRMPALHLVGTVPDEVKPLLASSRSILQRPFLDDGLLQEAYRGAHALILPSEIEGFGLPALEAYYLGTPVCYVKGTSVEEILAPATNKGGFNLDDPASLFAAMDEVVAMSPEEVRQCGLILRDTYASEKVAARILSAFREVKS
jgi:glycosyltransferase involved in cell wall biosynthesis